MTSIQLTAKVSLLRGRFNDVMATRRAYAASFGTGAALVACAALLFVLASAIVAFNGLPGDGGALVPVTVSASASRAPVDSPAATRLAAFAAASAGAAHARTGGVVVLPRGGGVVGRGTATRRSGSVGTSGGVRAVASGPAGVGVACCSSASVVGRVTGTVGQTAQTVAHTTGATVTSVSQTVGSTVTKVTGTVSPGAGRVVGGVVGGLGGR